jgi:NADH-quinone oxidoreductase subunit N
MFQYAPGLTVAMTIALASLAGIPPMGGWYAKFAVFRAVLAPGTVWGNVLAVVMAVNSVIAFYYYAQVLKRMWMDEPYLGDVAPVRVPPSLFAALALTTVATLAFGIAPGLVTHFTNVSVAAVASP